MSQGELILNAEILSDLSSYTSRWYDKKRNRLRKKTQYNKSTKLGLILQRLQRAKAIIRSIRYDEITGKCLIEYDGQPG